MMWRTKNIYTDIFDGKTKVEPRFTKNIPRWKSFDAFAHSNYSRLLWVGLYVWFYIAFAPSAWWFLLLPITITMGPVHGVVINWFAHKYGSVNHETDNTSKNLFKIDWLMFGEGYHNNHHVFPSRSNFASARGEFDPCYPIIKLLNYTGVIKMAKPEKPAAIAIEAKTNELEMIEV